jgi:hypothetical protein
MRKVSKRWFEHRRFVNADRTPQLCEITRRQGDDVYYRVYDGDPARGRYSSFLTTTGRLADTVGRYVEPPAVAS